MSNYTPIVNFSAKDALLSGDPAKLILGTEFSAELNSISSAVNSKEDAANKNQNNGYAGLDGSGKVPDARLSSNVVLTNDARLSDARTPTAHGHVIGDVTGLQSALDGKQAAGSYAAASHNHTWSEITSGKPTTLAGYGITDAANVSHNHDGSAITTGTVAAARLPSDLTAGTQVGGFEIGFRKVPVSTTSGTAIAADSGKCIRLGAGITIPASVFAEGDAVSLYNNTAGALTITRGSGLTMYRNGADSASFSLPARDVATIWFNSATECVAK